MNRLFWLLLFVYPITFFVQAPVLTFDEFYQEGNRYEYNLVGDTLNTNQNSINGENVFWDFTNFNYPPTDYDIFTITLVKWLKSTADFSNYELSSKADFVLENILYSDIIESWNLDFFKRAEDKILKFRKWSNIL